MKLAALFAVGLSAVALSAIGCVGAPVDGSDDPAVDDGVNPNKVIYPTRENAPREGRATVKITYHGGPVMTNGTNFYYIWYGNWGSNTANAILTDLANNIGGTPYWGINTTYYQGTTTKTYVKNQVAYSGAVSITSANTQAQGWYGTAISDANVLSIVKAAIAGGGFGSTAPDPNGIYFVLTSSEVNETSGLCTQYCGWHDHATVSGVDTKYSIVGNADRCITSCSAQSTGPNGNPGADGMASILVHEAEEATTDPDLNAWYDSTGAEDADKCAWTFGTTSTASNGSKYNVTWGSRQYLIQQEWSATTQACGMK